jgi:hypothetical protein
MLPEFFKGGQPVARQQTAQGGCVRQIYIVNRYLPLMGYIPAGYCYLYDGINFNGEQRPVKFFVSITKINAQREYI